MNDKDEEDEANNRKNPEKNHLHGHNRKERNNTRYDKWKYEKYEGDDDSAEIEEYHREIELSCDADMSNRETRWSREGFESALSFENDEKLGIRKTHIDKER